MAKQLLRNEVPPDQTWRVSDIFPSVEAWETELANLKTLIAAVTHYQGKLGNGSALLRECLEALETLQGKASQVTSYASLNIASDGTNIAYQAMAGKATAAMAELQAQTSFVQSEALALPAGTLEKYLLEDPGLTPFRFTIEKWIEHKPYMLAPETEMVLAALGQVLNAPAEIYERSRSTDLKFDMIMDGKGNSYAMGLGKHDSDADATLRRNAYSELSQKISLYNNTYGTAWGLEVKKNVVTAKLRGYGSAVEMLLHRQEVTTDIYHNLHDVILTELAPHWRKLTRLRKEVLGLDEMLYCDIEAPLDPEYDPTVTYEEASKLVLDGVSVLGEEYTEIIRKGLTEHWIDRADNVGKRTGAFCNTVYGVHPYVSMSWSGQMRNALTMAHELGHAGQGVFSQRYQRLSNARPTMFFIEAPSTINELLVANRILAKADSARMRLWVITQMLTTYHHNFVRHLIEGELQRRAYVLAEKGQPITASILNKLQGDILEEFYGGEVVIDDDAKLVWMRQSHYYNGLYPYSYSAGLTVGTVVSQKIEKEGSKAAERWIEVLKAGGTLKPLELCRLAGVDMSKKETIQSAVAYVGSLVDEVVASYQK
ncbi:MAG: oligoendopeptidase F [Negativicutes bacterium]|nr:oligoendopeptidase F [Negativicutes bacterium]